MRRRATLETCHSVTSSSLLWSNFYRRSIVSKKTKHKTGRIRKLVVDLGGIWFLPSLLASLWNNNFTKRTIENCKIVLLYPSPRVGRGQPCATSCWPSMTCCFRWTVFARLAFRWDFVGHPTGFDFSGVATWRTRRNLNLKTNFCKFVKTGRVWVGGGGGP